MLNIVQILGRYSGLVIALDQGCQFFLAETLVFSSSSDCPPESDVIAHNDTLIRVLKDECQPTLDEPKRWILTQP